MPKIQCHLGHEQSISTDDWVATLTLDQLRYARTAMDYKIKAAEAQPKRTVWRICRGGVCVAHYREDQYEAAADYLVRIYKECFMPEATEWLKKPYGHLIFERQLPTITPELVSQFEYDTEWFPEKPYPPPPSATTRGMEQHHGNRNSLGRRTGGHYRLQG